MHFYCLSYYYYNIAVCSPSPCESLGTITDEDEKRLNTNTLRQDSGSEETPSTSATPINESRERLFSIGNDGDATPTIRENMIRTSKELSGTSNELLGSYTDLQQKSIKSYLHTFDRRNSDTTYLLGRRCSGERINLADEIKKLSDHLLMLADINKKLSKETQIAETKKVLMEKVDESKSKTVQTSKITESTLKSTKIKKSENVKIESKINVLNSTSIKSSLAVDESSSSSFFSNISPGRSRTSSLSLRLQKSIDETPALNNNKDKDSSESTSKSTQSKEKSKTLAVKTAKTTTKVTKENTENEASGTVSKTLARKKSFISTGTNLKTVKEYRVTEAASIKRAKFRISQMSRDVPIGLPDMHQTVNLEEAANNTKDCLLHLLERYNETKTRNPLGRHQSISVDYNFSDNLEYRSMSSINAFFQRHNNSGDNIRQLKEQLKNRHPTEDETK